MSTVAVYRLYSAEGELLYVGIGRDVGMRFTSHRNLKPWWDQVASITLAYYDTREEALNAEETAIRAEAPRYNVQHGTCRTTSLSGGSDRERAWRRVQLAQEEMTKAITGALAWRFSQADVTRATGYSRERIRQLTKEKA